MPTGIRPAELLAADGAKKGEAGEINVPLTTLARLQASPDCGWAELLGRVVFID